MSLQVPSSTRAASDAVKLDEPTSSRLMTREEEEEEDQEAPSTTSTAEISVEEGDVMLSTETATNAAAAESRHTTSTSNNSPVRDDDNNKATAPDSQTPAVTPETRTKEKTVIAASEPKTTSPPPPPTEQTSPNATTRNKKDDEYDSSDDESSYFRDPRNLPEPQSERRYSYSSNHSASGNNSLGNLSQQHHSNSNIHHMSSRESDASLSFSSEDSEDGNNHHRHHEQEQFFPQGITRLHSYNSLISQEEKEAVMMDEDEDLSSSDPSVRDELRQVAAAQAAAAKHVPSGRLSPILGEHPPSRGVVFYQSPPPPHGASPPILMGQQQQQQQHFPLPYPQPHSMTPEHLAAWMASAHNHQMPSTQQQQLYPMSATTGSSDHRRGSLGSNLDYSEESGGGNNTALDGQQWAAAQEQFAAQKFLSQQAAAGGGGGGSASNNNRNGGGISHASPLESNGDNNPQYGARGSSSNNRNTATPDVRHDSLAAAASSNSREVVPSGHDHSKGFEVYWRRWIMLMYMSVLNLLSDWTCYSVAPIALLTEQAFGQIDPELLVTLFLGANAVASALEPIILSRLGLRRTVLFGALLLMMGSVVKSGGMPPIISSNLEKGQGEWRVYLGFFLVGLSQPLYQCTPALLSASWFPEAERTMATGVALNANQLGIGFAFIFGTLLVAESDDIPGYFGLLSIISTITFLGALIQFEDAPPTPPSDTARVMRGDLDMHLPSVKSVFESIRNFGNGIDEGLRDSFRMPQKSSPPPAEGVHAASDDDDDKATRRRNVATEPSAANYDDPVRQRRRQQQGELYHPAPSPSSGGAPVNLGREESSPPSDEQEESPAQQQQQLPPDVPLNPYMPYFPGYPYAMPPPPQEGGYPPYGGEPGGVAAGYPGYPMGPEIRSPTEAGAAPTYPYPYMGYPPPPPYWDPRYQQYAAYYQQQQQPPFPPHPMGHGYHSYQQNYSIPYYARDYEAAQDVLPRSDLIDEGVEPVLTLTPHHLDIDIRDDQVWLSIKACLARPGFVHALVSFTVSGIVINTLSTFMDYLVRLNGAGREYTGIVGGSFQFIIMISSLIIGKVCDTTRAYYSIAIAMLVLGAFGLAQCGVNLDADRGNDLRWSLIVVALLVGPLQPVSTELGVDVVYPLSENTVLVIQQLFSNLLSALFIPAFKAMKDIGLDSNAQHPEYTFSFYLLIVLHAAATVFFATFNGRYLRYEHEMEKKALEEKRKASAEATAFHRVDPTQQMDYPEVPNERMPLLS